MTVEDDPQFERWLDRELGSVVRSVQGPSPRAEQAVYRAPGRPRFISAPGRLVAGIAIAILAIIAGGVLAVAAYSGSPNPAEWAPALVRVVSGCGWEISSEARRVRDPEACERSSESPTPVAASPRAAPRTTPAGPVSLHESAGEQRDTPSSAAASGDPVTSGSPGEDGDGGQSHPPQKGGGAVRPPDGGQNGQQNGQGQGGQDKQSKDGKPRG